jgi:hypothetical protein
MNRRLLLVSFCFALFLRATAETQSIPGPSGSGNPQVIVPESVAVLVRPILDEKQRSGSHEQSRLNNLMSALIGKGGRSADEALVVLMCFDIGESHEDSVIERGRRMLPLLNKYREKSPRMQHRSYPDSMLRGVSNKNDAFNLAGRAITLGVHVKARDNRS